LSLIGNWIDEGAAQLLTRDFRLRPLMKPEIAIAATSRIAGKESWLAIASSKGKAD
jgi:hypothetical protein